MSPIEGTARGMRWRAGVLLLIAWSLAHAGAVGPLAPEAVPGPLRPWIDWVLYEHPERVCPHRYDTLERRCAWPSRLTLQVGEGGGRFTQEWRADTEAWAALPGDARHWPEEVTVGGEAAVVVTRDGRPAVHLAAGRHRVAGSLVWKGLPESLAVAPESGLVRLTIEGRPVALPDLRADGRLWLRGGAQAGEGRAGERLSVRVFRRIVDEVPLLVDTRIELEVAGRPREVVLGPALLEDLIPLRLASRLPARLERDGRLRAQVRPGRWRLDLTGRRPREVAALTLPARPPPWPGEEVWVFAARPDLRLVEIEGVSAVDPRQTTLPKEWRGLPAYRVTAGQGMRLKVLRRGDPRPEPNRLHLERELWLDFAGSGYTVRDRIDGRMTRGWRLETTPELRLGQARVDGRPQFITALPGSERRGVEVRRGAIALVADSRYEGDIRHPPAVGWAQDFRKVRATLHLPPGWRLLAATGMDNVPNTWLQRWTLLDLFLVLITALAVSRLWGWHWGLLALLTLGLIWHAPGAPRYVWLNILAASALLEVLPAGRTARAARLYRLLSLIALVLIGLPFLVQEVRVGLYPQLEHPWQQLGGDGASTAAGAPPLALPARSVAPQAEAPRQRADKLVSQAPSALLEYATKGRGYRRQGLQRIDPKASVQTGPGLPSWRWRSVTLKWNGPVDPEQRLSLWLLPPSAGLVLHFARVLLVLGLALVFLRPGRPISGAGASSAALAALLVLPMVSFAPRDSRADFPSKGLLQTLEERLQRAPACLPGCASVPRMRLQASGQELRLWLDLDAAASVAVPLPIDVSHWPGAEVRIDGEPASALARDAKGQLWVAVAPGRHRVELTSNLAGLERLQVPLALRPHRVQTRLSGWRLSGLDEHGVPDPQLELRRVAPVREAGRDEALKPGELPAFVRVYRTLRLGLDWRVETRVERVSPPGAPVLMRLPLIQGESVTTEGLRVEKGALLVNLGIEETAMSWVSTLARTPAIELQAPDTTTWSEVWRADIGPIWHVTLAGIAVVHHGDPEGRWLPEWRPWPGEKVRLAVTRPQGVPGPTLTIDASRLRLTPGPRASEGSLELTLRSSRGGQHVLRLPPGARLQGVTIDGKTQPIRREGRRVTLPVHPGRQQVGLVWRTADGVTTRLRTPEVDLGAPSVNSALSVVLGEDRWVLFAHGPRVGPAVIFWGVLLVVVLLAIGLGRVRITPLRTWHWLLLGVGLSQAPVWMALVVVAWLFALGARARLPVVRDGVFNLVQVGLVLLTAVALAQLYGAIQQGLLGLPDMQITGNGSTAHELHWYQDRSPAGLPRAEVYSVPLLAYRLLMLAWSLWLAFALLRWLAWGWRCFRTDGLWRRQRLWLPHRRSSRRAEKGPAPEAKPAT